jgi:hypothetical protein
MKQSIVAVLASAALGVVSCCIARGSRVRTPSKTSVPEMRYWQSIPAATR